MEVLNSYLICTCGVLKFKPHMAGTHTGARDVQGFARLVIWHLADHSVLYQAGVQTQKQESKHPVLSSHSQGNLRLEVMPTFSARCMRAAKYLTSYLVRIYVTFVRSNSSNYLDVSRPRLAKRSHLLSTLQGQQIIVIMISCLIPSGSLQNIRITDSDMCSEAVKMFC